ncbi:2-oxo acid dehydrogenase subunit E2 [Armatimonas rosea]|uniref:Dihydrolipoamide acetyltransferase component of pyruvate dehydrogenase complex n=1 Tax=Armatimonas rosea TaxID=685828 RepID=A0A7W9SWC5_ARMRO|nr:2-oxo acid dehydrogenase subunit E2 [Armatimonas rosea]MBB6053575.1 pyruvate dehydrogenase E2 component (dihydrolipoamide acetyltransferase) [Armatimonas rosea]
MSVIDVLVPQMGEGLQEVLLVEFFKKPGERITRDEPFYSMETDKATMDVECPHEGVLVEWLAAEGDTLAIGAPVCRMEVSVAAPEPTAAPSQPSLAPAEVPEERGGWVPPRTRAYAKEKGIDESVLATIPAASGKLMPADIDAYLKAATPTETAYTERPVSPQDKTFIYRLKRSAEQVIPATAKRQLDWGPVRAYADKKKAELSENPPSAFNCVAYAIAKATAEHPKFRSTLLREEVIREHAHVNLGIAVARPSGELVVAVVSAADSLSFEDFVAASKGNIALARDGRDQATEATQLLLTYMGPYEIIDAVPVLVAPAAAVLFIGSPFEQGGKQVVNIVLTFDHRLVHGVEAAEFLRTIARNVESLE